MLVRISLLIVLFMVAPRGATAHDEPHDQIHALSKRMKTEGSTTELLYARGRLHLQAEHWRAARNDLQRVVRAVPADVYAKIALAEADLHLRRFRSAERLLKAARAQKPSAQRAPLLLAEVYRAQRKFSKAAEVMQDLLSSERKPAANLYLQQAELLEDAGKHEEAKAIIDDGIAQHGPIPTLVQEGSSLRRKGPKKIRYDWLKQHGKNGPMTPDLRLDLAELANELEQNAEASEQLRAVIEHLQKLPEGRRNAPALLKLQERVNVITRALTNE